jgi:menaquinone-9 beta-reductase
MINIQAVQKYDCDVLITGGGPGGSALAYSLAQKGIKTIVLEAQQFPRDKICGDGVSPIALAELHQLGITGLEAFARASEISKVGLFIKEEKAFIGLSKAPNLPFHARIIPRLQLDNWIYEAAKKQGAVYLENTRLVNYCITGNLVTAEVKQGSHSRQIRSKVIVGADGSNSTVARILNNAKPSENFQLLGLRAYYENVNGPSDRVDIFFTGDNFPGIYWMFPVGEHEANIGLAMVAGTMPKNETHVKTLLTNHVRQNKSIAERIGKGTLKGKISGWPLTFYNPGSPISGNRLLLIGDAAGLINPLSGDGIQYALLSARWASECLAGCVAKNDFSATALHAYREKVDKELGYDFALSSLLIQFARNKTLTSLWMEIMLVLIKRAREDKKYAAIIAGIFEGTHPSYKALTPDFILKTLLEGSMHIGLSTATGILRGPQYWLEKGKEAGHLASRIADSIKRDPSGNARWIAGLVTRGVSVAGHVIRNLK